MFENDSPTTPVLPPVAPIVAAPSVPTMPNSPSPRRKSRLGLIAAIVVFFIFVLVGGAAAYYFLVFRQDPEYVLSRSMLAMSELESVAFDVNVQLAGELHDTKDDDTLPLAATFHTAGAVELVEGGDFVTSVDVAVDAGEKTGFGPYAGEVRQTDKVMYLNLSAFTIPSLIPGLDMSPIINTVTNRWIEIDTKEIADMIGAGAILKKIEETQAEQDEKYEAQIEEAVREYFPTFFTITDTLERETVHGVTTHHFAYTVNEDALRGFFGRVQEIVGEDLGGKLDSQIEDVNAFLDGIEDLHGEMWIGTADSYLHKMTLTGKAVLPEGKKEVGPLQISLTAELSAFNEPVVVEVPDRVTAVQDVMSEVMAAIMETAASAKGDEDEDGLTVEQEDYYDTDPSKADTDGDGFNDGDEVNAGYNPNGPGALPKNSSLQVEFGDN